LSINPLVRAELAQTHLHPSESERIAFPSFFEESLIDCLIKLNSWHGHDATPKTSSFLYFGRVGKAALSAPNYDGFF